MLYCPWTVGVGDIVILNMQAEAGVPGAVVGQGGTICSLCQGQVRELLPEQTQEQLTLDSNVVATQGVKVVNLS